MTNSDLFKKAHKIARLTAKAAGSYKIAFIAALKDLRSGAYEARSLEAVYGMAKDALKAFGAKEWYKDVRDIEAKNPRIYLNDAAELMGYHKGFGYREYFTMKSASKEICEFLMWVAFNKAAIMENAPARRSYIRIDDDETDDQVMTASVIRSMSNAAARIARMEAKRA